MAYLFLDNAKKDDGMRTTILADFFKQLYDHGLQNPEFFLTDKDRAQINAAQQIWPLIKNFVFGTWNELLKSGLRTPLFRKETITMLNSPTQSSDLLIQAFIPSQ